MTSDDDPQELEALIEEVETELARRVSRVLACEAHLHEIEQKLETLSLAKSLKGGRTAAVVSGSALRRTLRKQREKRERQLLVARQDRDRAEERRELLMSELRELLGKVE